MNNKKTTKRALLSSVMAIVLCLAMLIGTTFAWFTDSASTAVNKIQSGNLDVKLLAEDGVTSLEGATLEWQKAAGAEDEDILWEPGCRYKLQPIIIKNAGTLALKYKIVISGIDGDAKLNKAIEWTINGVSLDQEKPLLAGAFDTLTIEGHMKEEAGNEYQGLSIDGIGITVIATQDTVEYDSNNNTYDENANDSVILANPANVQNYLDGEFGSIDGKTIILSAGNYGKLELGRATKYRGSNTDYYIGVVADENKKTYEDFVAIKTSGQWSASAYYVRNMSNVTIKAAKGATVTVAGLTGGSGHVYGESYDYVLDKAYTSGSAYYLTQNWSNITIEGITFTAPVDISSSLGTTVIDGVAFKNCAFNINNTASGNQALRYYNENNDGNVKNLTVDSCSFKNCFQGVYTQKINGVTVINSSFDTTAHNAIAVQSGSEPVNHKAVVITGNTFANIGDRIIRFGSVGADTQITIKNNTATDSGDSSGQVMKAQSLAEGVTYNISGNNWGEGKTVANTELTDR